jgi:hypothetical protein
MDRNRSLPKATRPSSNHRSRAFDVSPAGVCCTRLYLPALPISNWAYALHNTNIAHALHNTSVAQYEHKHCTTRALHNTNIAQALHNTSIAQGELSLSLFHEQTTQQAREEADDCRRLLAGRASSDEDRVRNGA